MGILKCIIYLATLGIVSFIVGRIMPKNFNYDKFPFAPFEFENNGKIYKKIGITKWQSKVPDMSRIFRKIMPAKKIEKRPDGQKLYAMVQETCVAEFIHFLLIICGFGCLWIWKGFGGRMCFWLNAVGNMVFIVIQRYNRPRLVSILKRNAAVTTAKGRKESETECVY